jgi:biofilm PGA synthesis N-glycosyltransferase PgaC
VTESSPGLRRATDRQILLPRSAKAGPLALPPAPPQLSELESVEAISGEIATITAAGGPRHATISCIIPCYNEQDTIADVLKSLLGQTRMPDVIHVIINNTDDDTPEIARTFEGTPGR